MSVGSEKTSLIVLLGGAGYIGTHLMLELHGMPSPEEGKTYQVAIIDRKAPSREAITYAEARASGLKVIIHVVNLEGEVTGFPVLPQVPYCGIMLAALKDVNEGERIPYEYLRSNITICVNSMQYLTLLGCRRLIQASSSTVYALRDDGKPVGVYGYSKQVSEEICERLLQEGQQLLIFRYMNPIGTHPLVRAFPEIGICQKLTGMTEGEVFVNRGNCVRDYIHITDLAALHSVALQEWEKSLFTDRKSVVIENCGTGVPTTTAELVEKFSEVTGKQIETRNALKSGHEGYDTVGHCLLPSLFSGFRFLSLEVALRDYA